MEASLKEKELVDVLRKGKPEDFQYIRQEPRESPSGYSRGVVVQKASDEKARVYIGITCF